MKLMRVSKGFRLQKAPLVSDSSVKDHFNPTHVQLLISFNALDFSPEISCLDTSIVSAWVLASHFSFNQPGNEVSPNGFPNFHLGSHALFYSKLTSF